MNKDEIFSAGTNLACHLSMSNTHIFCRARYYRAFAAMALSLLLGAQVNAASSQSRLLVSVTVVEMCHLTLNLSIQAQQQQQFNKLRDSTKTFSCEAPSTSVATHSPQPFPSPSPPNLVNVDTLQRGFYNVIVDESAGQMTLTF
jgi:hypothetical protein